MNVDDCDWMEGCEVNSLSSLTLPSLPPKASAKAPEVLDLTTPISLPSGVTGLGSAVMPTADPELLKSMEADETDGDNNNLLLSDGGLQEKKPSDDDVTDSVVYIATNVPEANKPLCRTPTAAKKTTNEVKNIVDLITPSSAGQTKVTRRSTAAVLRDAADKVARVSEKRTVVPNLSVENSVVIRQSEAEFHSGQKESATESCHGTAHNSAATATCAFTSTAVHHHNVVHNHYVVNNTINNNNNYTYTLQNQAPVCRHDQLHRRVAGNRARYPGREYVWCPVCSRAIYMM